MRTEAELWDEIALLNIKDQIKRVYLITKDNPSFITSKRALMWCPKVIRVIISMHKNGELDEFMSIHFGKTPLERLEEESKK